MIPNRIAYRVALAALLGTACGRAPFAPNPGASAGTGTGAGRPRYEAIDLGTLGGVQTLPIAINDAGVVVGSSQTVNRINRGFVYENGAIRALPESQSAYDETAQAINAAGEIAGVVRDGRAVLVWGVDRGAPRVIQTPAAPVPPPERVTAINEQGNLLVSLDDYVARAEAVISRDGVQQDLGGLGSLRVWTYALAWNARGQVVGMSRVRHVAPTYEIFHPFLWENGVMEDMGVRGSILCGESQEECASGEAVDINTQGVVVGTTTGPTGRDRAFVWENGVMRDLGVFEGDDTHALAINDRGQILFTVPVPDLGVFVWDNGGVQRVGPIGVSVTARALSEQGAVIGEMQAADGTTHAFVWQNGALTDLGPGGATAVNARGDIIGTDGTRGILWRKTN